MKRTRPFIILLGIMGWFALQPLLNIAVVFVATVIHSARAGPGGSLTGWYASVSNLLLIITNALVLVVICLAARRQRAGLGRFTGLNVPMRDGWAVLLCVVGGISANTWFTRVLNSGIVPDPVMDSYSQAYQMLEGGSPWVALVATVLAAPLMEELIFRGIILRRLRRIMPVGVATVMQAILFGIAHGNLLWGLYAGVLGAILGYLTIRGGGLRTAVCFHMAFNAGAYLYGLFGTGIAGLLLSGALFLWAVWRLCRVRDGLVS